MTGQTGSWAIGRHCQSRLEVYMSRPQSVRWGDDCSRLFMVSIQGGAIETTLRTENATWLPVNDTFLTRGTYKHFLDKEE